MPLTIATAPANVSLSKSGIIYQLQSVDVMSVPYSSNTIPDGYVVTIKVYFEDTYNSGSFAVVATTQVRPDANGQVEVDLSQILDNEIQASFPGPPIPAFDESDPYVLPNYKNYYITYQEDYVNFAGSPTTAPTKSVLYGGLYQEADFFADASSTNSLVGDYNIPSGKRVSYDQPEFISWYNYTGSVARVYVEVESVDEDGTLAITAHYSANTIDVQPGQIITFPIGPETLGLSATRVAYTAQVVEQVSDTRFSEARKYRIDVDYQRYIRYLMYLNIFGAPETLRCTGAFTEGIDVERRIAAVLQNNTTILRYAKQQYSADFEQLFTYRTGYLAMEEINALKDLLIHNQVYEVSADGFTAILINTNSFQYTESDFLFSLQFSATPAASQTFASGLAAVNWDLTGAGGGGTGSTVSVSGFDQLYPDHQTNQLIWTRNGGEVPADSRAFFRVIEDGVELTPGPDYSITPDHAPGQALVTLNNFITGANYRIVAQYITVS
jgi:hypothetical protein